MGQKLCAFYQKCGAFWVKKIVRFFVLFLAKVGAPLSSKLLKTLLKTVNGKSQDNIYFTHEKRI